jgi:hypothetical protein
MAHPQAARGPRLPEEKARLVGEDRANVGLHVYPPGGGRCIVGLFGAGCKLVLATASVSWMTDRECHLD